MPRDFEQDREDLDKQGHNREEKNRDLPKHGKDSDREHIKDRPMANPRPEGQDRPQDRPERPERNPQGGRRDINPDEDSPERDLDRP